LAGHFNAAKPDRAARGCIRCRSWRCQHSDPLQVIIFNPATNRSEDVSHAIAWEILRRCDLEADDVPSGWKA